MTVVAPAPAGVDELVDAALIRVREYLLARQASDGSWSGHVESDPRTSALYLITRRVLGRAPDARSDGVEAFLRRCQLPDGSWEVWPGGGGDASETRLCALALDDARTEGGTIARAAAEAWLATQPPPADPDAFWRFFQAVTGKGSWRDLPYISPRFVALPDWFHPNLYDLGFFRIIVVAVGLIQATRDGPRAPTRIPGRDGREPLRSLFRRSIWNAMIATLAMVDRLVPPTKATAQMLAWLLAHQEEDGSFFAASQPTSIGIMTLHAIGPIRFREQIERGMEAIRRWQVVDEGGTWQQFTDSTTWDTASSVQLLRRLGVPRSDPRIRRAVAYLCAKQGDLRADWSHRARRLTPGGWAFQRSAAWYPDVDDTAIAVEALLDADPVGSLEAVRRGLGWILGMQNRDGGWASWDRNDRAWAHLPELGPWMARDRSCADITARVATVLARVVAGRDEGLEDLRGACRQALRRAHTWLARNRHSPAWLGIWFTHYLHGTAEAVEALRAMGDPAGVPLLREARDWVLSIRNADGGWGESPRSAFENRFVAAPSTNYHTAQALKVLVHAGAVHHPAALRAAQWLLDRQRRDGAWIDTDFSAAGVPGLWYSRYHLMPTYVAGEILQLFRSARSEALTTTRRRLS